MLQQAGWFFGALFCVMGQCGFPIGGKAKAQTWMFFVGGAALLSPLCILLLLKVSIYSSLFVFQMFLVVAGFVSVGDVLELKPSQLSEGVWGKGKKTKGA
jgi:hypothetical protein